MKKLFVILVLISTIFLNISFLNSQTVALMEPLGYCKEFKDNKEAINFFTKSIEETESIESYFCRGVAYCKDKQYAFAINDFTKAIQIAPNFGEAKWNIQYSLKKLAIYDQDYSNGLKEFKNANYSEALESFTKVLNNYEFPDIFINIGQCHSLLEQYDLAITNFDKAILLNPYDAFAWANRGYAYFGLQIYDQSLSDYKEAFRLDSELMNQFPHIKQDFKKVGIELNENWYK